MDTQTLVQIDGKGLRAQLVRTASKSADPLMFRCWKMVSAKWQADMDPSDRRSRAGSVLVQTSWENGQREANEQPAGGCAGSGESPSRMVFDRAR